MGSTIPLMTALLLLTAANAAAAEALPKNHVQLMVPVFSQFGYVGRDELPDSAPEPEVLGNDAWEHPNLILSLIGIGVGRDITPHLRGEAYVAEVLSDGLKPRTLVGVRLGPQWDVYENLSDAGRGMLMRFVGLGGIAYRSRLWDVAGGGIHGQHSILFTASPAWEADYYTSASWGYSLRFNPEFSYVLHAMGDPLWIENRELVANWDGYRWSASVGIELGLVF